MDTGTFWLMVVAGMLTIIYAILRPMRKRKDPLDAPPRFGSLAQQRAVEEQMSNLLVELSEMARQISAQLDTRSAKLDLLIKEADEKIAALQALRAGEAPAAASPRPLPEPKPLIEAAELDARHAEVYALADGGRSSQEIAQKLGRPNGEIELILALRPRK